MTFWDIAAGILVAAFFIACIWRGLTIPGERAMLILASILAGLLIIWRASCWHGDIQCEAHSVESADHQ